MAKKAATPAKASFPEPTKSKAELLREWWSGQTAVKKFSEVKGEIEKLLTQAGHTFNENSDYLGFQSAGKATGKIEAKTRGTASKGKISGFASFVTAVVESGVTGDQLTVAISIVSGCESVEQAREYAEKWENLIETIGDATKAQEVVQLFS